MVEALQPDVIAVTESWRDDEISDGKFSLPGLLCLEEIGLVGIEVVEYFCMYDVSLTP